MQDLQYSNWPDEVVYNSKVIRELIIDRSLALQIPIDHLALFLKIQPQEIFTYLESDNYMEHARKIKIWKLIRMLELLGVKPIIKFEIKEKYDGKEVQERVMNNFKHRMIKRHENRS